MVHNAVFWGVNGYLTLISHLGIFESYKIQKGKSTPPDILKKVIGDVTLSKTSFVRSKAIIIAPQIRTLIIPSDVAGAYWCPCKDD